MARVGSFEWNVQTGLNTWTPELEALVPAYRPVGSQERSKPGSLVYCDDRTDAIRLAERALESGDPVGRGVACGVAGDGSLHWLAGRRQAFKDESGKPLRMIGVNIGHHRTQTGRGGIAGKRRAIRIGCPRSRCWHLGLGYSYRQAVLSPRWKMLFGYGENDIGDSLEDWARLLHPDERDWILKFLKTTSLRARQPRLPSSSACVTRTVPTAGSWHTPLSCEMSKAKRSDS